jgi:hypothetical protein
MRASAVYFPFLVSQIFKFQRHLSAILDFVSGFVFCFVFRVSHRRSRSRLTPHRSRFVRSLMAGNRDARFGIGTDSWWAQCQTPSGCRKTATEAAKRCAVSPSPCFWLQWLHSEAATWPDCWIRSGHLLDSVLMMGFGPERNWIELRSSAVSSRFSEYAQRTTHNCTKLAFLIVLSWRRFVTPRGI